MLSRESQAIPEIRINSVSTIQNHRLSLEWLIQSYPDDKVIRWPLLSTKIMTIFGETAVLYMNLFTSDHPSVLRSHQSISRLGWSQVSCTISCDFFADLL